MDAKVATLVVTGVVAVGTLIYYLFFDNKNEPQCHRSESHPRRNRTYEGTSYNEKTPSPRHKTVPPPRKKEIHPRNSICNSETKTNSMKLYDTTTPPAAARNNSAKMNSTLSTTLVNFDDAPTTNDFKHSTSRVVSTDIGIIPYDKCSDLASPSVDSSSSKSSNVSASSFSVTHANPKSVLTLDSMDKVSNDSIVDSANQNTGKCRICNEPGVILQPCKHKELCKKHAINYLEKAKFHSLPAYCPLTECQEVIEKYV